MKKNSILTAAIAACLIVGTVWAGPRGEQRRPRGGGGGDVPTPFLSANTKVELADGEVYTLIGHIRLIRSIPYLEVDLNEHGWLAGAKRKAEPFYPLEASPSYWAQFEDARVKLTVEAHGVAVVVGERAVYALTLQPLVEPVLLE